MPEYELDVDIDKLTIRDLVLFEDMRKGRMETDLRAIYEILSRVVAGGVDHIPAVDMWTVTAKVLEKIGEARNPKAEGQASS